MYLSQYNIGPDAGPGASFLARAIQFLVRSGLWIAGLVFTALVTIGTFFFAMAAIIGAFILAGAVAIAWFLFRVFGRKAFAAKGFDPKNFGGDVFRSGPETLDATHGPEGWTVDRNRDRRD
jgi:hypothetical protein